MSPTTEHIQQVLASVKGKFRGPGGAIAVLRKDEPVVQTVWGYADLERQIPMTTSTLLPICSISKQMFCMIVAELARDPKNHIWEKLSLRLGEVFGTDVVQRSGMKLEHLYNMQSGIRDYWAMTVIWGAVPEGLFSIPRDGPPAVRLSKTLHFQPGTEYSYSNVNFHLLGRMLEDVTGEPLERLLSRLVFTPANMRTATLCPNTAKQPPPCVGYEGSEEHGYFPAINNIEWSGDAGIVASLNDMIAYDSYLDRNWSVQGSAYHTMTQPSPTYNDGKPATYGFGLGRDSIDGISFIGHYGGLRGFALGRFHIPEEHMSIIVMFNHETDPESAIHTLVRQLFDRPEPPPSKVEASKAWPGVYLDKETELAITVQPSTPGVIRLRYARSTESLRLVDPERAESPGNIAMIGSDSLTVERLRENRVLHATRVKPISASRSDDEFTGSYYSDDVCSTFRCSGTDGVLYGSFEGYLGIGPMHLMRSLGQDVWALACPRAMDSSPPGDWTVIFKRDEGGRVNGVSIGCWLARNIQFKKLE